MNNSPLQLRADISSNGCIHVVQIATPAQAVFPDGVITGTIVDIETFFQGHPQDWDTIRYQVKILHEQTKEFFFQHILKPEAIASLDPEY